MKSLALFALALIVSAGITPVWAAPADVPLVNWPAERGLDATVTLESPRLKLSELVATVAAQSKVKLNLPTELLGRSLVVRANKMALSELLPALGQLYGLEWTRAATPDSFSARVAATPTELAALQLGEINQLRERVRIEATLVERATLDAAREYDGAKLGAGIALADLPASLRESLQRAKQQRAALNYLEEFAAWTPFQMRQMRVRVALPRANPAGVASAPQFVLVDGNGNTRRNLGAMELPPEN